MVTSGTILYVGKIGNATACSQTAGSAIGCELMVYDISSTTNPIYVKGIDVLGDNTGTGNAHVYSMAISGTSLYIGKNSSATACSQTPGSAIGCELMVFDISSTTNPVYVNGLDSSGNTTGTGNVAIYSMIATGTTLYIGKSTDATACSQTAGSAIGCELMVFDISSTTNPVYTKGLDSTGSANGTGGGVVIYSIAISETSLYTARNANTTGCSQTAGSAIGCEIMVFDISSSTNPVYTKGLDSTGSANGTGGVAIYSIAVSDTFLYVGKYGNITTCSQTVGSANGCELMIFDISSSTNPVYRVGLDSSGDPIGIETIAINSLAISGSSLYIGKDASATACSQTAGSAIGCELMVFDISSPTNPVYTKGLDASGSVTGTVSLGINSIANSGPSLYIGKDGNGTACSQVAGSAIGCELMQLRISLGVSGTLTGSSAFNTVTVQKPVSILASASTTNLTINTGATLVAPVTELSISGDYTNNGTFTHNSGTTSFIGAGTQTATGTMTGTSAFGNVVVTNSSATTTFGSALTALSFTVPQGNSIIALPHDATTTVVGTLTLTGTEGNNIILRSSQDGTQTRLSLEGGYSVAHVDIKDVSATSTTGLVTAYPSVDSGNNTGWTFTIPESALSSFANQVFGYGQGSTPMSPITIVDYLGTITASNDIRIRIATSSANMLWDTTDTTATFSGTASAKVGNPVSYEEGGSILVVPVSSDFVADDTLTISDLSYTNFTAVNVATTAIGMRTSGVGTTTSATDPQTVAIYGSLTLDDHSGGQVVDSFSNSTTETDTELYALRFIPGGEFMDITSLVFGLLGVQGITQNDLTNVRLFRDENDDQVYDGGDTQVGGTPDIFIDGQTGTITFSTTITASTTEDYLLVGDLANLKIHDALIVSLTNTDFTIVGTTTGNGIAFGSALTIQHIRSGGGGGGGGASRQAIGDPAPAGDGIQTGGSDGGGGEIDPNTGDIIGSESGFNAPGSNGTPLGAWTTGANAYSSDGVYTTTTGTGAQHSYGTFGFTVPSNNQITGIAVKLEASGSTAEGTIDVKLSWDNGSSVTSANTTATLTQTDGVYTLGGQGDTWGRTWTPAEMDDGTFTIELIANPSANTIRVDAIQVKVFHQATGGGGGGGGAVYHYEPEQFFANAYLGIGDSVSQFISWLANWWR